MDATRSRRTRDAARQRWYSRWRCVRFARLGATKPATPRDKKCACYPVPLSLPLLSTA